MPKFTIRPAGINHDINPAELGPEIWNDGSNVVFNDGYTSAAPGWKDSAPGMLAKPLYLLPVLGLQAAVYYWISAGNNDGETAGVIGVTDGVTHWDITPVGGLSVTAAGDWTGGVLNGVPFLNNGVDPPIYWDRVTANPMLELPGWPANTTCKALRAFKYHLIAMNITDLAGIFEDLVIWSAAADPGTIPQDWMPDPSNDAGNFSISATTGGIVDGGQMRDQFMVYKTGSSTVMQYIAGQFVFSNRQAFVTSGILARNCWAEMYGQHYVLTDGDFIRHNGQEVESLVDGINRKWLFEQIDADNYLATHIAVSHQRKQVWVNFPKSGHTYSDTALVFDLVSKQWGQMDFDEDIAYMTRGILNDPGSDNSFDARTDTFDTALDAFNTQLFNPTTDVLVFCRYEPKQMFGVDGFLREGATVPVYLQLLSKPIDNPTLVKLLQAIWVNVESSAGIVTNSLRVRVGTQMALGDPITWTPQITVLDGLKADTMAAGRYISIEITGTQTADWRLNSLDIDADITSDW